MNRVVRLNSCLDPSVAAYPHRLDDLLAGFFRSVPGQAPAAVAPIKIEVSEDATAYRVTAVLPGVKKEDIHIEVDQNEVSIVAELKRETATTEPDAKDGERLLHSERFYGKLSRVFSVAQDIEEAGVQAKVADGVLTLVLPKKAPVSAKRVTVQ